MTERVTIGVVYYSQDGQRLAKCVRKSGAVISVALPHDEPSDGDRVLIEPVPGSSHWRLVTIGEGCAA